MSRPLAAATAVFLALGAAAAEAPKSKPKTRRAAHTVKPKPRARVILDGKTEKLGNGGPNAGRSDTKPAGTIRGEVANTDIFKGVLSVRSGRQATHDYAVTDETKIVREAGDKPDTALVFDAIEVGDAVEVSSQDGKTALEIRVHGRPSGKL